MEQKNNLLIEKWANNVKRREFLENYRDWGLWFETQELRLSYYKFACLMGVKF